MRKVEMRGERRLCKEIQDAKERKGDHTKENNTYTPADIRREER